MAWAIGSRTVRILGASFVAAILFVIAAEAALWFAGRRGEERAMLKVERKANTDTAVANEVRNATPPPGRAGKPDPFMRNKP